MAESDGDAAEIVKRAEKQAEPSPAKALSNALGVLMFDPAAQDALNAARSAADVNPAIQKGLEEYRTTESYARIYETETPLVSVCVCTYNRAQVLAERCVSSVLAQDYRNLEVIVVGDGCTDDTENALRRLGDSRVTFVNLPRSTYPEHPFLRWLVAGTIPMNHARAMARGDLMTHLDDDDAFLPSRITKLVAHLKETRAELVWHPFWYELDDGKWAEWSAPEFRAGQVTSGSVLYLSWFKRIECDPEAYRYLEPADWNLYRRLKHTGARLLRYPEPLLRHHRERKAM